MRARIKGTNLIVDAYGLVYENGQPVIMCKYLNGENKETETKLHPDFLVEIQKTEEDFREMIKEMENRVITKLACVAMNAIIAKYDFGTDDEYRNIAEKAVKMAVTLYNKLDFEGYTPTI